MAAIIKIRKKEGIAYKFQVKVKDPLTGQTLVRSQNWTPGTELTDKAAQREAIIRADAFEKEVKSLHNNFNPNGTLTPDSTFAEVADAWLEKIRAKHADSYIATSEETMAIALPHLGKIKLNKLTPVLIQNFFNFLDKREKITHTVISKPAEVRATMKAKGESYASLTNSKRYPNSTICHVLTGKKPIALAQAHKFANLLDAKVDELFEITETRQPYAWNTNHHIKAAVRATLSFAKKKRLVPDNYATSEYIDFPKRTQADIKPLDEDQVALIYQKSHEYRDIRHTTALLSLIFTGFRRGELVGLRWENIDLENRLITIERAIIEVNKRGIIEKDPKTKQSARTIDIPNALVDQLVEYKAWYDEFKAKHGDRWKGETWLFINDDTARVNPSRINAWIKRLFKFLGIEHHTVHAMRHTNITIQLLNNIPVLEVSGKSGHSRTSTTTDIYGHYIKKQQERSKGAALFDAKFAKAQTFTIPPTPQEETIIKGA